LIAAFAEPANKQPKLGKAMQWLARCLAYARSTPAVTLPAVPYLDQLWKLVEGEIREGSMPLEVSVAPMPAAPIPPASVVPPVSSWPPAAQPAEVAAPLEPAASAHPPTQAPAEAVPPSEFPASGGWSTDEAV